MNITDSNLERICKSLLQRNVTFEFNNKIFKKGKVLLFAQKNFYITFILSTDKKNKDRIEIPMPYDTEVHEEDNLIYFDYRIKTLTKFYPDLENIFKMLAVKINGNKFWNSIMTINIFE